jgi:NAD+ synthetase
VVFDVPKPGAGSGASVADPLLAADPIDLLFRALVVGIRDYARKTGFRGAVLGVSGGIDSAVTAALAAAALGAGAVTGIAMPSRHSSDHSVADAKLLCRALGCRYLEVPIEPAHAAVEAVMGPVWREIGADSAPGLTEENVQSRIRGVIVMAHSNKTGALVVTTGNKSEFAVGYCTLYGDMNGGLAVLCDLTKGNVYRLARWMNAHWREAGFAKPPIPEGSIAKPPSAELRPGQLDQDTLPDYDVLDEIVERFVEHNQSAARIARETGFDAALVARIARMIDQAEYKRKQMPIGLKVTSIAFGRGRRMPVVQGYRRG